LARAQLDLAYRSMASPTYRSLFAAASERPELPSAKIAEMSPDSFVCSSQSLRTSWRTYSASEMPTSSARRRELMLIRAQRDLDTHHDASTIARGDASG